MPFAIDGRFVAWAAGWSLAALLAYGLVAAIIPNPVFGRQIPPEPFAIWVWLASAPLVGILGATYSSPARPAGAARPLGPARPLGAALPGSPAAGAGADRVVRDGSALGTIGSLGAFLAIGCPVCNKIALVLLGTSGALTVFAPLQPVIGVASLLLLALTCAWRLRLRGRAAACAA